MVWKITLLLGVGSVKEIREGKFAYSAAPLVMANILSVVIIRLFDEGLGDLVTPDGVLILSGILVEQADKVVEAAEKHGFKLAEKRAIGGLGCAGRETIKISSKN